MNKIIFPIENELVLFENNLKEIITQSDNFLTCDLEKFIFTNPKRLRPIFIFLFSKILKINSPLIQDIAIITELIHNASLIHDDIIDEEKIRRNHPTFYEKYGAKLAVLEGDLLLSLALEKISNTTLEISKIFAQKIKETIQGEIKQNENINKITNIKNYLKKTTAKTANLFIAGLESLFTLSKENKNLTEFMKNYAIAFQIKNDIDNFQKNSSDFKNGNYTLPVIYCYMKNNAIQTNDIDYNIFIKKSHKMVEVFKAKALKAIENIEDSQYKTALINLVNQSLRS